MEVVQSIPKRSHVSDFSFRPSFLRKKIFEKNIFENFDEAQKYFFKNFFLENEDQNQKSKT